MNKKHIVLFDMDGTLTEPREEFDKRLLQPLRELSNYADIGILTGSDLDYVNQQLDLLIRFSELRYKIHLLPCNGTKHLLPPKSSNEEFEMVHEMDMEKHLGTSCFRQLMMLLCSQQETMCYNDDLPLTGHFISYRGSTVNWCPIGRNANNTQRQKFVEIDNSTSPTLRQKEMDKIKYKINLRCSKEVMVALGGETSFDIYPNGWDKTYALKHFPNHTCWFVGDRCGEGGNDKEIYDLLKQQDRGFWVKNTEDTADVIMKNIIPRLK